MDLRDHDVGSVRGRPPDGRGRLPGFQRGERALTRPAHAEWRLVDDVGTTRSAAEQMQADLRLLDSVTGGAPPALRLYTWPTPALSLGRFQADTEVDRPACRRLAVGVVRRPSGGRALLHGGDLTYAVAMPRPEGDAGHVDAVYARLADGLIAGLARIGVVAAVAHHAGGVGPVCFSSQQGADLRVGTRKVCGSAQVQRDRTVLQHGAIPLRRLAFDETDVLVGGPSRDELHEVTVTLDELDAPTDPRVVGDALVCGFSSALDIRFTPDETRSLVVAKGR